SRAQRDTQAWQHCASQPLLCGPPGSERVAFALQEILSGGHSSIKSELVRLLPLVEGIAQLFQGGVSLRARAAVGDVVERRWIFFRRRFYFRQVPRILKEVCAEKYQQVFDVLAAQQTTHRVVRRQRVHAQDLSKVFIDARLLRCVVAASESRRLRKVAPPKLAQAQQKISQCHVAIGIAQRVVSRDTVLNGLPRGEGSDRHKPVRLFADANRRQRSGRANV